MLSAMNVEYVCVILVGISMSGDQKEVDIRNYNLPKSADWNISGHSEQDIMRKASINGPGRERDTSLGSVVTDGLTLCYKP